MQLSKQDVIAHANSICKNTLMETLKDGYVYAKASFIHKGRTTQLLQVKITDDNENLISLCKLTTVAIPKST